MRFYKKDILSAIIVATLLLIAYALQVIKMDLVYIHILSSVMTMTRHIIHTGLMIIWIVSLYNRILHKHIRRYLVFSTVLLLFWLIVRVIKWEYTTDESTLSRYCWYSYYIPIILIPLFGAFIVKHIGKPEQYIMPRNIKLLYIPAFLLILTVFTNDIHRLVFGFPVGLEKFDIYYRYELFYYIIVIWSVGLSIYFIAKLFLKCKLPRNKTLQVLPVLVFISALVFWTAYYALRIDCDFAAINCLIIFLMIESCIQSGLIRSNSHYTDIFRASTVASRIVDRDYNVCYSSAGSYEFCKETMLKAENGSVDMGDFRVSSECIPGGKVLWMDDISKINELIAELKSTEEQLSGKNNLLRAELDIKEKKARIDEQIHIYDNITRGVSSKLDKLDILSSEIKNNPYEMKKILMKVCVIGAFIKRRGNLIILGENNSEISARELEFCLRESLDNFQLKGIIVSLNAKCKGMISLECIIAVYDFFEEILEQTIDTANALMINLNIYDGELSLVFDIGNSRLYLPDCSAINVIGGDVSIDMDDTDTNITIRISKGGVVK